MTSSALRDLRDHLEVMFQFDNADLDFGVYKVLRLKKKEVEAFLNGELGQIVTAELSKAERGAADAQFQKLAAYVREEKGQKYHAYVHSPATVAENQSELLKAVAGAENEAELVAAIEGAGGGTDPEVEDRVYNHLLAFFGRYYQNGDFGYNDRSLATYKVDYPPAEAGYDGSDVLLHWKHRDSYYVKTANGFPTVRFEVGDRTVEYRLETGGEADEQARTRNNNKDDGRKHYGLDRVDVDESGDRPVVRAVFRLAERSTPKADVFGSIMGAGFGVTDGLGPYLYRPAATGETRGKPAFSDLEGDYDKVENGGMKGHGQLKVGLDAYLGAILGHPEFRALGSNNEKRKEALEADETARRLLDLDRNLNRFYVGVDADYFVHKDLGGFLRREAGRYVKDVVLSGVEGLLAEDRDETAFLVARAFYRVADRITAFLAATEEFQKNLFLRKKKVARTSWLVSVGKLAEWVSDDAERNAVLAEVHGNQAQRAEWSSTFGVEVADPSQYLLAYPTLPIDTRHFPEAFALRLLSACPDIEGETTGVLLNSENLQGLRLLDPLFAGKVQVVYIDPPYNTAASEILYKNHFKHSSWLSLCADRVDAGMRLMTDSAIQCTAIDDAEESRLDLLLKERFGDGGYLASVVVRSKPQGRAVPSGFSANHEYALFHGKSSASEVGRLPRTEKQLGRYPERDEDGIFAWSNLRKTGGDSDRTDRPKSYYPIYIDKGTIHVPTFKAWDEEAEVWIMDEVPKGTPVYPIDDDGKEKVWSVGWERAQSELGTSIKLRKEGDTWQITRKYRPNQDGTLPGTWWGDAKYSASESGTKILNDIIGPNKFSYPKSIHTVEDCLRASNAGPRSVVLDYFGGSGTTAHAVLRLNADDGGRRRFVLIEMGEYFDRALVERTRRVMYSFNWVNAKPKGAADGTVGLVKVQVLEGYEDVLDALVPDEGAAPVGVPLRYLYRPQEHAVRSSLDLTRPFSNVLRVGKGGEPMTVDVMETYSYLQGFPVRRVGVHTTEAGREVRWFRSGHHLVAFRDVEHGQDDADDLLALLGEHEGVEALHVNEYVDQRRFAESAASLRVVTAADFDRGASWS